jgi:hypothetical protein
MPVTYRRIRGAPVKVTRAKPDPRLDKSPRWERVEPATTTKAGPADKKEG